MGPHEYQLSDMVAAIDAVTRTAKRTTTTAPRALSKRAHFYERRSSQFSKSVHTPARKRPNGIENNLRLNQVVEEGTTNLASEAESQNQ